MTDPTSQLPPLPPKWSHTESMRPPVADPPGDPVAEAQAALNRASNHLDYTLGQVRQTERAYQERRRRDPVTQDTDQAREAWAAALIACVGARVARERAVDELEAVRQHAKQL